MRYYILSVLLAMQITLFATPYVQTIMNSNVYHASYSDTRCVTAFYDPTNLGTALTYMTVWDISDPVRPLPGKTIYYSEWIGLISYRQPTIYGNLLLYLDEFHLHILDVENIYTPTQLFQLTITQAYCFAVFDHYLVLGNQDGTLVTYNISNPTNIQYVSTSISQPAIWMMWASGDKLAVRCGNYSHNTAKLYCFNEDTEQFTELGSVTIDEKLTYVGTIDDKLVLQSESGYIGIYNCSQASGTLLVNSQEPSDELSQIISGGSKIISISEDNCIRVWQLNSQLELCQSGFFDLSHMQMDKGALFELRNDRLLCSIDTVISLVLDVSDNSPELECVSTFADGSDFRSISPAPAHNTLFYLKNNSLASLRMDAQGDIMPDGDIAAAGFVLEMESAKEKLHLLTTVNSDIHLQSLNMQDFMNPSLISDITVESDEFFSVRENYLYQGSLSTIDKYQFNASGVPVWQRELSYSYVTSYWIFTTYFYDITTSGDTDYGVGMFGNWFDGYYPILVYWQPDGTTGCRLLPDFFEKVTIVGDYLYLSGNGINVYRINSNRVPQLVTGQYDNLLFSGVMSSTLLNNRYLIESYQVSNNICVFDLQNPPYPVLIQTIHQSSASYDLLCLDNRLVAAKGEYGVKVYALQVGVDNQDDLLAPRPQLQAYPNPFAGLVTLQFNLDKPSSAQIECFNIRGQLVYTDTLADAKAGINSIQWNGHDKSGRECSSGIYIVKVRTASGSVTQKITKINIH